MEILSRIFIVALLSIVLSIILSPLIVGLYSLFLSRYARTIIAIHDNAALITGIYVLVSLILLVLFRRRKLIYLVALTPGIYIVLVLPLEIIWSISRP